MRETKKNDKEFRLDKSLCTEGLREGTVVRAISSFFYVWANQELYECKARGVLKKKSIGPLAGDKVTIRLIDEINKKAVIEKMSMRTNLLIRPPIANVTQALLVFSIKDPDPNLSLIDRFIVLAEEQNLDIALCFSKADLDKNQVVDRLMEDYGKLGYPSFVTSVSSNINFNPIKNIIKGKINVLAGPSGAGKSSLLNRLFPDLALKTGEISPKTGRGRHTTRHVELLHAGDETWIADTPGFSSLSLNHVKPEELKTYFKEFHDLHQACRFGKDCYHENEPQCAVKEAVAASGISRRRYNSYLQLLSEVREANKRRY